MVSRDHNLKSFEKNQTLAEELEQKLREMAGQENVKIKKIDRLHDDFKDIANKYSVNKSEFYRNLSLNDVKGSFNDTSKA